jgi:sugar-specific transcriptional regulator TrmB
VDAQDSLIELGFTSLEADAYCELLRSGPATAYRVAKQIGRPTANTYQALATLLQNGAVDLEDGDRRLYRATDPGTLLHRLDSQFARRRAAAAENLNRLKRHDSDNRVYRLANVDQAMDLARDMVASAREIVLVDLFPGLVASLREELSAASQRRIFVAGLVYAPYDLPGTTLVESDTSAFLLDRWPGQQLTIIADASRFLTALLDRELNRVLHAFTSDNAYLACLQHSGLAAEIRLTALQRGGTDALEGISLLNAYPSGLAQIVGENHAQKTPVCE